MATQAEEHAHLIVAEMHRRLEEVSNFLVGRVQPGAALDAALVKLTETRAFLHSAVLASEPITTLSAPVTAPPTFVTHSTPEGAEAEEQTSPNPPVNQVPVHPAADPTSALNAAEDGSGEPSGSRESVAPINVQTGNVPDQGAEENPEEAEDPA